MISNIKKTIIELLIKDEIASFPFNNSDLYIKDDGINQITLDTSCISYYKMASIKTHSNIDDDLEEYINHFIDLQGAKLKFVRAIK